MAGDRVGEASVGVVSLALIVTSLRSELLAIPGLTDAQRRAVSQLVDRSSADLRDLAYL